MVKGIEHVAILSQDTKRLSDWYKDMFDLKTVYDNGKGTYFLAFESGDMLETNMDDIEVRIVSDYLEKNRRFMEE